MHTHYSHYMYISQSIIYLLRLECVNYVSHSIKLISSNKSYKNRFGFLRARSIEDIQNQLNDKYLITKKMKLKSALVALDQSSAFNLVSHVKLCIKLFDLIKASGDVKFYSVCLGFSTRWLGEGRRLTIFKRARCKVWRGVPQGSPLSCCLFVCYFDFCSNVEDIAEWYFADDSTFWISGCSWSSVETKIALLLQEFQLWCSDNDQVMNASKTQVLFIRRQRLCPGKFNYQIVPVLKSLGIWIDQSFCFAAHVKHISTWIRRRIGILKSLRARLKLSSGILLNIAKSWRSKLIFGTYWILQLSTHQLTQLTSNWPRLIKAALGLFRPVPFSTTLELTSLDSIEVYLVYWFAIRWFESRKFDKASIFTNAAIDRANILNNTTRERQLRVSTQQNTLRSILNRSTYTQNIFSWLDKCKLWVDFLEENPTPKYKELLKKKVLSRPLDKSTVMGKAVLELNEKYFVNRST